MKKGFTLIEVIMATLIVLTATFAIISLSNNSKHLFELITNHNNFAIEASTIIDKHSSKNVYENLVEFNIDNDEIIKILKEKNLHYKLIKQNKNSMNDDKFSVQVDNVIIYDKFNRIILYKVNIQ